jgi:tetratricopeptide (TPR) repeat protein
MQRLDSRPRLRDGVSHRRLWSLVSTRLFVTWYCIVCGSLLASGPTPGWAANDAELAYAKGILAYGQQDYQEALAQFQRAVALEPANPDAQFYLGLSHSRLGDYAEAIPALERALQLAPAKQYIHYHLGLAYVNTGQYVKAIAQLEQAARFDPDKAATPFYLGYAHYQRKQYRQALPFLERARELDASLAPSVQFYRGAALYAMERDAQAQEAFEATIAAEPTSTLARNAQRYLQAIDARARDRQLVQLEGTVKLEYDDNVTIGDDDIISREDDGRTVLTFSGRLIPIRTWPWRLGVEYTFYQSLHFELDEFNLQQHTGRLFAELKLGRVTLGAAADYTYTLLDNERYFEAVTAGPSATIRQTEDLFAVVSVRYRTSNYFNQFIPSGQEAVRDHDGWSVQAGFDQYLAFNKRRSLVRLSYYFEASRNDGSDWEYDSHRIGLGLHTPLWWGIMLHLDGAYTRRDYRHVNSFDAGAPGFLEPGVDRRERLDDRLTAAVTLSRAFGRHLLLSVGYTHTTNLSNIDFFEYHRNIVSLAVTGRY